jgi:extracellular factor (EF) 3-hydroxypalmitic acid methyl ester biosynthesis protein
MMICASTEQDKASVDQLVHNLDFFAGRFQRDGEQLELVEELISLLAATYDDARERNELQRFREICQNHPLHRTALDDPFTRRAFEKPRGYAGDAVMLDYIYRPRELQITKIGHAIHHATTAAGAAKSIRWRRSHLAARLLDGMENNEHLRVLSVASGHLRELDIVSAATSNRNVEILALDRDKDSLDEAVRSYREFTIRPLNHSISYLFKPNELKHFDLIYSAGLFDYLTDRTTIALIDALVAKLRPEGRLILGNYTPANDGRGYMEGMMDWRLIYRDKEDLMRLASVAAGGRAQHAYLDTPGNIAYVEIGGPDRA